MGVSGADLDVLALVAAAPDFHKSSPMPSMRPTSWGSARNRRANGSTPNTRVFQSVRPHDGGSLEGRPCRLLRPALVDVSGLDRGPAAGRCVRPRPRACSWWTADGPAGDRAGELVDQGLAQDSNFGARARQGHHPDRFEGLYDRPVMLFSRRSPRNRADRGPRCRRVEVRPTRARAQESEQAETPKPT